MRLLLFTEYLDLLEGGAQTQLIDENFIDAYLTQAERLWPVLRIGQWTDRERKIESVVKCHASGKLLVHISANWDNCFLILVVGQDQSEPEAYFLFDIGAEYNECRFTCPEFDLDQVAEEEMIRKYVPQLNGKDNPFAILAIGDGTYIQTYVENKKYDVEFQLVSLSSHYCLEEKVDADTVINMFLSYAFGRKEWAREHKWIKMEI